MVKLNKGERAGIMATMLIIVIASIILWSGNRSQATTDPEISAKADSFATKATATEAVIDSINSVEETRKRRKEKKRTQPSEIQMEPIEQFEEDSL